MRDPVEIQRAHDLLIPVLLGEIELPIDEADKRSLQAAVDVLCWVLRHDHNDAFATNLKRIERLARAQGLVLR